MNNLPIMLILLPPPPPFLFLIIKKFRSSRRPSLPPGPYAWPIIGNILEIRKNPHIHLAKLAQVHGPLMSLLLGKRAPIAASEILKTHDSVLSAWNVILSLPCEGSKYYGWGLFFSEECNDSWRNIWSPYRKELFSGKALESQVNMREKKVDAAVFELKGRSNSKD